MTDADRIASYNPDWTIAQVIKAECKHYGLPVSIDALLRHIYNNRDMVYGAKDLVIRLLEEKLSAACDDGLGMVPLCDVLAVVLAWQGGERDEPDLYGRLEREFGVAAASNQGRPDASAPTHETPERS